MRKIKKRNQTKGKNSHDVAAEYIKELDLKTFNQLVDIYKVDFEIFGYEVPNYDSYLWLVYFCIRKIYNRPLSNHSQRKQNIFDYVNMCINNRF